MWRGGSGQLDLARGAGRKRAGGTGQFVGGIEEGEA